MTTKYFDNRAIIIEYDKERVCISDRYNNFCFTLDANMKKYFVPYIERLYKICDRFKTSNIPTHKYTNRSVDYEVLCNGIASCYRKYGKFEGNYMDMNRVNKIISAFRECFKRVKEKDIEMLDLDLKTFNLRLLLYIKRGLL
jgi:hypothetical protein